MKCKYPKRKDKYGPQKGYKLTRSFVGASLTELMIATLLIGFTTALIGELVVTTTIASVKSNNNSSMLGAAKVSTERLINDIQMARAVGDFYGVASERYSFPASDNPIYGSNFGGNQPVDGWPASPWQPLQLSSECLILQQPVVYLSKENSPSEPSYDPNAPPSPRNGFPIRIKAGQLSVNVPPLTVENLDTIVYQVVADSAKPGEYLLQMARFPGFNDPTLNTYYEPAINPPQTIAHGIIGPKDPGNPASVPQVFKYLKRNTTTGGVQELTAGELTNGVNAQSIIGVSIDLEFRTSELANSSTDVNSQNIGIHNEAFLKSNRLVLRNYD